MILALLTGCGNLGETDSNVFDFEYTDEGTIVIQGFIDDEEEIGKIIISKEINGKEVTHIGHYAF